MNPNLERILTQLSKEEVRLEKHEVELALVDEFKSLNSKYKNFSLETEKQSISNASNNEVKARNELLKVRDEAQKKWNANRMIEKDIENVLLKYKEIEKLLGKSVPEVSQLNNMLSEAKKQRESFKLTFDNITRQWGLNSKLS